MTVAGLMAKFGNANARELACPVYPAARVVNTTLRLESSKGARVVKVSVANAKGSDWFGQEDAKISRYDQLISLSVFGSLSDGGAGMTLGSVSDPEEGTLKRLGTEVLLLMLSS